MSKVNPFNTIQRIVELLQDNDLSECIDQYEIDMLKNFVVSGTAWNVLVHQKILTKKVFSKSQMMLAFDIQGKEEVDYLKTILEMSEECINAKE